MKSKSLLILFLATAVLIGMAVVSSLRNTPVREQERDLVFADLGGAVNEVARIRIEGGGQSLTMARDGEVWHLREADDYPADFGRIRQTVLGVAELRLIAPKTRKPDQYATLGVDDPDARDSASRLLTLEDAAGTTLAQLIVGKRRLSSSPGDSPGLYIRMPDQDQALLVEGRLDAGLETSNWIDRDLFSIEPERITEITVEPASGDRINLIVDADKKNLILTTVPAGKQARSEYVINRMRDILEKVQIDGARSDGAFTGAEQLSVTEVKTSDGLMVTIDNSQIGGDNYARFSFHYEPAAAEQESTAAEPEMNTGAAAGSGAVADSGDSPAGEPEPPRADPAAQAAELTARTSGWWYRIPDYKYQAFNRQLDDLVEDVEPEPTDPPAAE